MIIPFIKTNTVEEINLKPTKIILKRLNSNNLDVIFENNLNLLNKDYFEEFDKNKFREIKTIEKKKLNNQDIESNKIQIINIIINHALNVLLKI